MKPTISGWKLESPKFKDYSHELAFGAAIPEKIAPLGRSIEGVPVVFQGAAPACVSCAVAWIKEWMEIMTGLTSLCWLFLYQKSGTRLNGVTPSKVLDIARKVGIPTDVNGTDAEKHKIPGYFFLRDLSSHSLYSALKQSPIMVGVANWRDAGPHMMVAYDVKDEKMLKGVSFWTMQMQELVEIPFNKVIFACRIADVPEDADPDQFRHSIITTVIAKAVFLFKKLVC